MKIISQMSLFDYRLHLIVDAQSELPVDYRLTKASGSEPTNLHEMLDYLADNKPEILDTCNYFLGDRGYDGTKLIQKLEGTMKSDVRNFCAV